MSPSKPQAPSLPPVDSPPTSAQSNRIPPGLILAGLLLLVALGVLAGLLLSGNPAEIPQPATANPPSEEPLSTDEPLPTDTPRVLPPLAPGGQRVLVARFSGDPDAGQAATQWIEATLLTTAASEGLGDSLQVLQLSSEITSSQQAREALSAQEATLVIWGTADGATVKVHTIFPTNSRPGFQRVAVAGTPAPITVLFPPDLEFVLSANPGGEVTFLAQMLLGELAVARSDYSAADAHFQSALLSMPASLSRDARDRSVAIVNFYNSVIALESGQTLDALQASSQAVRLYEEFPAVYNNRGTVYFATRDFTAAREDFQAALDLNSQDLTAMYNRALTYLAEGDTDEALLDAERLLVVAPDEPLALNLRGLLHYTRGDYTDALDDFTQALDSLPDDPDLQFNLAATLDQLDRSEEAVDTFTRLLQTHPDDALALTFRGDAYLSLGQPNDAVTDYDEALKIDPELVYALQQHATFYLARENSDIALRDLQIAAAADPENARTFELLGRVYLAQDDFDAALEAFDTALALQPLYVEALAGRGHVRRVQRTFITALEDLQQVVSLGGSTPEIQYDLGLVYYELGEYTDAQAAFEGVLQVQPDNAAAYGGLAITLDAQIKRAEAEDALAEGLALEARLSEQDYLRDVLFWSLQARNRLDSIFQRLDEA